MRRRFVAGLVLVLLTSLFSGCSAPPAPPAPGPALATPGGAVTVTVADRPFTLHVPEGYDDGALHPLLVVLHGYSSSPEAVSSFFGLPWLSGPRGMLVAAPQGTTDTDGNRFWNAARACCDMHSSGVDDSGYLAAVIDSLLAGYRVDPQRVYLAGHSNGGYMALRFACDHADRVAAVVSVAGAMDEGGSCRPAKPVSVLQIHGDQDPTVRIDGGVNRGFPYTSAEQTVSTWRRADGCPRDPGVTGRPVTADPDGFGATLSASTWTGCDDGTSVALWRAEGADHVPVFSRAAHLAILDWLAEHARVVG